MVQSRSDLDDLTTEAGSDASTDFEARATLELVQLMNAGDSRVPDAVAVASTSIADAVDAIAARMRKGGRLVYVGAGSSGRIAALDASECESTFSTEPGVVVAVVAGGEDAPPLEQEAAEDDRGAGARDLSVLDVDSRDSVVGVSASGRTPYVLGAIAAASEAGALTACIVSVDDSELAQLADHEIAVVVGPEFLAGSTRLKAGTAQKLVLNTLSTLLMIRLGKTYGNLMVDVNATNEKLRARVRRIVRTATGASPEQVDEALEAANGSAKVAIVSLLAGVDAGEARARLADTGGSIRLTVEEPE
ncbi:MAG TPA: N-acetylmuramic acid 6-phosphate etherase [Gaiellaceae bacterium]|nr:N-acetylmuramic acid 6-phosphate etherase [Gaiellaceae bacterium]